MYIPVVTALSTEDDAISPSELILNYFYNSYLLHKNCVGIIVAKTKECLKKQYTKTIYFRTVSQRI